MSTTARENILRKIKQALAQPVPVPFPASEGTQSVFQPSSQENAISFAENFSKLQGRFSFCADEKELVTQLQALITTREWTKLYCRETELKNKLSNAGFSTVYAEDLAHCDAAITGCESLIARTGSIVLSSAAAERENGERVCPGAYLHCLYPPAGV
jgi:L-lactate dehydrogenase complex protein LldG